MNRVYHSADSSALAIIFIILALTGSPPPHPTFQCQDLSSKFRGLLHKRDGKKRDCDAGENDNRDQSRAAGTCFLPRSPSLSRPPSGFPCDQPLPPSRVLPTRSTSNGPELLPSQRVAGEMRRSRRVGGEEENAGKRRRSVVPKTTRSALESTLSLSFLGLRLSGG